MPAQATPKVELGFRTGYGIPFGDAYTSEEFDNGYADTALNHRIEGQIPLWLDLAARLSAHHAVGAYFSYGFGISPACRQLDDLDLYARRHPATDPNTPTGISCGTSDMRLGAEYAYHVLPRAKLDPWFGIGAGYESTRLALSVGGEPRNTALRGWELVNLQLGLDIPFAAHFAAGPFVTLGLAEYNSASGFAPLLHTATLSDRTLHEWLFLGVRGTFVM